MSSPPLTAFLHAIRYEAQGIISLELRPAPGSAPFPPFDAGAHIDLHLPNGLVRSYSLLNPTTDKQRYVVGVLNDRNSRGGSRCVHDQLRVGMTLQVSAPRNNFGLQEAASHSVLLAGGIGITPLLCMLRRLVALGKPVDLIQCARSNKEAAFMDEIKTISAAGQVRVHWHFDDEQGGPPDLKQLLAGHPADTHLYCCGPGPMLDAFERACDELGYTNTHIERFAAAAPVPAAADAGGCSVELRRSGMTIQVPAGKSVLDALLDAGVAHDYSCKEGICGACETKVLEGEVEHHDSILTKDERAANKSMMVCVSRCKRGPLVLDI